MRDADTEDEPAGKRLAQSELPSGHGECIACPDVRDAGRYYQRVRRAEQQMCGGEHLAPDCLARPQRAVPRLLDLARGVANGRSRREVELAGPDAYSTDARPVVRNRKVGA